MRIWCIKIGIVLVLHRYKVYICLNGKKYFILKFSYQDTTEKLPDLVQNQVIKVMVPGRRLRKSNFAYVYKGIIREILTQVSDVAPMSIFFFTITFETLL
jgi:hypothetical protein